MFMYIVVIARIDARFSESENFGKTLGLYKLFAIENIKASLSCIIFYIYL